MASETTSEYVVGAGESEGSRLLEQCELHRMEAELLFDRIGVESGWDVIDVGCGPLGVLDILAERVGPTGSVVGLDREPRMLELATRSLAERGLTGVQLVQGATAATGLPARSFDLVHERLVLVNLDDPEDVVAEMVRLARPGGYVAVQDFDAHSWICQPAHPAWDRLKDALARTWVGDPFLGRRLPGMLRDAGLVDVDVDAHTCVWRPGDAYQMALPYLAGLYRERLLATGALSGPELAGCVRELRAHLAHPDTLTQHNTLYQSWGRKPCATC